MFRKEPASPSTKTIVLSLKERALLEASVTPKIAKEPARPASPSTKKTVLSLKELASLEAQKTSITPEIETPRRSSLR